MRHVTTPVVTEDVTQRSTGGVTRCVTPARATLPPPPPDLHVPNGGVRCQLLTTLLLYPLLLQAVALLQLREGGGVSALTGAKYNSIEIYFKNA